MPFQLVKENWGLAHNKWHHADAQTSAAFVVSLALHFNTKATPVCALVCQALCIFEDIVKTGEIVTGRVAKIVSFGIYLVKDKDNILVLLPELDWRNYELEIEGFTDVGVEFQVKILGYVPSEKIYRGSIKQAYPELNPWSQDGFYDIGKIVEATVMRNTEYGSFVRVAPLMDALIHNDDGGGNLPVGIKIKGKVIRYEAERQRIQLEYVST